MENCGKTTAKPPAHCSIEVELRDLEGLLRGEFGKNLVVNSFKTSSFLPAGENYGSTMLKVEAELRRNGSAADSKPEHMVFVAKMLPPTEFQRMVFESPLTFRKEINMFTRIIPTFQILERECGLPEVEVFDPIPKLYGSRLSLEPGEADKFDEDAAILMEDLKLKNYSCGDRKVGVDLVHAKLLVKSLARFHSLGVAVKMRKPQLFQELKVIAKATTMPEDAIADLNEFLMNNARKISSLLPHLDRIERALPGCNANYLHRAPAEPWGTIIHTDLWVNNVMFRDDGNGNPEDVKLVDFQNYAYNNPLLDLVFFLFTSCNSEVRNVAIEDLVDLYYETFISNLARLKFDVNLFSRDSFNTQLANAAKLEYSHCLFMIRVIIMDAETDPAAKISSENFFKVEISDDYRQRFAEISLRFLKENWI